MPGPKPKLSFRVDHDTYKTLKTLADLDNKTISDYTREVIEIGIGKKITAEQHMLDEFRLLCSQLNELTARAIKAGAGAKYYSQMSTNYAQEMTQYLAKLAEEANLRVDPKVTKKQKEMYEKESKQYEQHYLEAPWDKI